MDLARRFAVGQTVGTWMELPGLTAEIRARHQGQVVDVLELPPRRDAGGGVSEYLLQVAYPWRNFDDSISMLFTTLIGNDTSTALPVKLVDLTFPEAYARQFPGPRYGLAGWRQLAGVSERPLVLNMIKPCVGLSPAEGAAIFYETALGGVDFIKDDELLGDTSFSPLEERTKAYVAAARRAEEETGKRVHYVANVTGRPERLKERARRAVAAGAGAVMVNWLFTGPDALVDLVADGEINVPVLAHCAGTGLYLDSLAGGVASRVLFGRLARLAGADAVIFCTPMSGGGITKSEFLKTAHYLRSPHSCHRPSLPVVGGGATPGQLPVIAGDIGLDVMIAAGGAVQGHPMGAKAGAKAMMAAAEAVARGLSLAEVQKESPELAAALQLWGGL